MNSKNKNFTTLDELKDKTFGKIGSKEREEYELGYENFKIGVMLQQARIEKGMTQQELAEKVGTTSRDSISLTREACAGISELTTETAFQVYPNPSNGNFTVNASTLVNNILIYNEL
jgi:hypothetical protein